MKLFTLLIQASPPPHSAFIFHFFKVRIFLSPNLIGWASVIFTSCSRLLMSGLIIPFLSIASFLYESKNSCLCLGLLSFLFPFFLHQPQCSYWTTAFLIFYCGNSSFIKMHSQLYSNWPGQLQYKEHQLLSCQGASESSSPDIKKKSLFQSFLFLTIYLIFFLFIYLFIFKLKYHFIAVFMLLEYVWQSEQLFPVFIV